MRVDLALADRSARSSRRSSRVLETVQEGKRAPPVTQQASPSREGRSRLTRSVGRRVTGGSV